MTSARVHLRVGLRITQAPHDDRHTANISVDVNAPEIERISITVQRPGTDRYASGSGSKLQSMRSGRAESMMHIQDS